MISNTCMVTGPKKIDPAKTEQVHQALRREILAAIDDGCTHFISGFDQGVGLIFASIVVELKQSRPITLEAAIPYRNRINTKNREFQRLFAACDIVGIHTEKYSSTCYAKRNHNMVELSTRVLAVYDGRAKGSTYDTMCCAHAVGKEPHLITV